MWRWVAQAVCWVIILAGLFRSVHGYWSPDILSISLGFVFSSIVGTPIKTPSPSPGTPPPLPHRQTWLARTFSLKRWPWFFLPALFVVCILALKIGLAGQTERARAGSTAPTSSARTIQSSAPAHNPPPAPNPFDRFAPVPRSAFVERDQWLAARLNVTLPLALGQQADPNLVWETRQRMFLSLPENAHLYSSDAVFASWSQGMQEAANEAATRGVSLDDYQLMEAGRVRAR